MNGLPAVVRHPASILIREEIASPPQPPPLVLAEQHPYVSAESARTAEAL
jgi:hypothetical protein